MSYESTSGGLLRITPTTGADCPCWERAAMKASRSRMPSTRPSPSTTGKSCCEPDSTSPTTRARLSRGLRVWKSVIMARVTGMPLTEFFICTRLASCEAPIHTKKAMNSRVGLPNRPASPNSRARPWPTLAAICVART